MTQAIRPRDRGLHPPALTPGYRSSLMRAPRREPVVVPAGAADPAGPTFGEGDLGALDSDLTRNFGAGDPIGERILVHGRVLDEDARAVPGTLVEIWQANAGGRYRHPGDGYRAPLDPGFGGAGRAITDGAGGFAFRTIRPGPYPWPNGPNAWRPAHIHLSVFGRAFAQRLVTQMYFEGDPLVAHCPIAQGIPDARALGRLTASLDLAAAAPFDHLAYRFDVVLRGRRETPFESPGRR